MGGLIAWGSTTLAQRQARSNARTDRRREAYAAFILSCDHLARAWSASETLEPEHQARKMGELTGSAVREVQRTYIGVLLTGTSHATSKANKVRLTAWELNKLHRGQDGDQPDLYAARRKFANVSNAFIAVATAESTSAPQSWTPASAHARMHQGLRPIRFLRTRRRRKRAPITLPPRVEVSRASLPGHHPA